MSVLASIATLGAGVASHLLYFKRGEHHVQPLRNVQVFLSVCASVVFIRSRIEQIPLSVVLASTATFASLYLLGLYTSLLTYRIFFNPLNKIPGPFGARIWRFNFTFSVRGSDRHRKLLEYHQKYGYFVRVGPNDVSVTDPRGVQLIHGLGTKCTKAPWYDGDLPLSSMHTTRDRSDHDRRRRIWSPAFSDKALRGYEERIQKYNDLLLKQIEAHNGEPLDLTKWINLYSFDVMGDLGFGQPFDCLESGEMHWAIELLSEGMKFAGLGIPDWLFRVMLAIPGATSGYHRFIAFCSQRLDERIKSHGKSDIPDITHVLVEDFNNNAQDKKAALPLLQADTRLIIVAGSDTSAATLTNLFYYLATYPALQDSLRNEIAQVSEEKGNKITHQSLRDAAFLNGAINEALRLHPPVPSGLHRKVPDEGMYIGDTFLPGGTVTIMPQYVMARDKSIYPRAEEFIPERWYSKPDLVIDKSAFHPFSIGTYGCIGKNVALTELRTLTAQIVSLFDVALAPGEDGRKLLTQSEDHFTLGLKSFNVVFRKREATVAAAV